MIAWSMSRERRGRVRLSRAFTLVEVVVSVFFITLGLAGILSVSLQSAVRANWSAQSLSAQMMALSGLERCRAAKFDPRGSPATDNLVASNFPPTVDILDVGSSRTNL